MGRVLAAVLATAWLLSGAVPASAAAAEPPGRLLGSVAAVDVDGDAVAEIATLHETEQDLEAGDFKVELAVRRGSDGTPLWNMVVPLGQITLTPAAVGPDGSRGVYVMVHRFGYFVEASTTSNGVSVITPVPLVYGSTETGLDVYAVKSTGELVWEHHVDWTQSSSDPTRSLDAPLAATVLQATGSAADDVLLVLADTPTVIVEQNQNTSTIRTNVLEGADGSVATATVLADQTRYWSTPLTTGDFDSDGLDDYALQLPETEIVAHRGADGARLWATDGDFFALQTTNDLTGDGAADVLATRTWFSQVETGAARLIDGRSGATRVATDADAAWATNNGIATATRYQNGQETTLELARFDVNGNLTQARDVVVAGQAQTELRLLGDLNRNGTQDLTYTLTTGTGTETKQETAVVDGATLAPLWGGGPVGQALRASVSGDGDDLFSWSPWGEIAVEVSPQRGATGEPLWTTRLIPTADATTAVYGTAADVTGDGRADILAEINAERATAQGQVPHDVGRQRDLVNELHVLDARTGAVLWSR